MGYSNEKNVQMLICMLKHYNIKNIIVSPGTTNVSFVASVQQDSFFNLFSAVDERSAAFMACGMAKKTNAPVVITCTGATASRNYLPGLTEAYYSCLPIIAVTGTRNINQIGHNIDQVIDRTVQYHDVAFTSVTIPPVGSDDTCWEANIKLNKAFVELKKHGLPIHINLTTQYSTDFSVEKLPQTRIIECYLENEQFPDLNQKKVAILIGNHSVFTESLTEKIERFCEIFDSAVLFDATSNYRGKYGIPYSLLTFQENGFSCLRDFDVVLYIGSVSAASFSLGKEYWRINPDGEIRDPYRKTTKVFCMDETVFFEKYTAIESTTKANVFEELKNIYLRVYQKANKKIDQMPLSSLWIVNEIKKSVPDRSIVHYGILNSVRCANFFYTKKTVAEYCNTGGFGIDGCLSSAIGSALNNPERVCYCVLGDLAFFYDINSILLEDIPANLRVIIANNGIGGEFKNKYNQAQRSGLGEKANPYIAADGHFRLCNLKLAWEDKRVTYAKASSKQEFDGLKDNFFSPTVSKPMILEVTIDSHKDVSVLPELQKLNDDRKFLLKSKIKKVLKRV